MTCIVGIEHDNGIVIGGDSAGTAGHSMNVRTDEKVFERDDWLFGFTTSFRMGQLIRYELALPDPREGVDPMEFMIVDFIRRLRSCLKSGGFARKHDEEEIGGNFVVGFRGKLYVIDSDYQVGRTRAGFAAVGSGARVAEGALFATKDMHPKDRVRTALKAAEAFTTSVRGPFKIIEKKGSK